MPHWLFYGVLNIFIRFWYIVLLLFTIEGKPLYFLGKQDRNGAYFQQGGLLLRLLTRPRSYNQAVLMYQTYLSKLHVSVSSLILYVYLRAK